MAKTIELLGAVKPDKNFWGKNKTVDENTVDIYFYPEKKERLSNGYLVPFVVLEYSGYIFVGKGGVKASWTGAPEGRIFKSELTKLVERTAYLELTSNKWKTTN